MIARNGGRRSLTGAGIALDNHVFGQLVRPSNRQTSVILSAAENAVRDEPSQTANDSLDSSLRSE